MILSLIPGLGLAAVLHAVGVSTLWVGTTLVAVLLAGLAASLMFRTLIEHDWRR